MTDQIRALIEALALACEDDRVMTPWRVLDVALGLDPGAATFGDTAAALRGLLPTRDPRIDPRPGDIIRVAEVTVTVLSIDAVAGVTTGSVGAAHKPAFIASESLETWPDWSVAGDDPVQVLYVAPDEVPHVGG